MGTSGGPCESAVSEGAMAVTLDIEENLYMCLSQFGAVASNRAAAVDAGVMDVGDVMVLPVGRCRLILLEPR
jgi:hypothetical protein